MFNDGSDWQAAAGGPPMCESCGEEPATVHVLRVDGAGMSQAHLCHECAEGEAGQVEGAALVIALPASIGQMFGARPQPGPAEPETLFAPTCAVCGTTLSDLRESGLMGCAACYDVFADFLDEELAAPAGDGAYPGKVPSRLPGDERRRREIVRLQRMLQELVESERFEEAASVRDRLAELESSPLAGQ